MSERGLNIIDKRGLSEVVTTVLLILLIFAASIIIWAFVRTSVYKGSGEIDPDIITTNFRIPAQSIVTSDDGNLSFVLKRNAGEGDLNGVTIVLEDFDKNK